MSQIDWVGLVTGLTGLVTALGTLVKLIKHQKTSDKVHQAIVNQSTPGVELQGQPEQPAKP